jgi:hypothetical protein
MKVSSSGLWALIGGPWVFFAADPPIKLALRPPSVPRVNIASYGSQNCQHIILKALNQLCATNWPGEAVVKSFSWDQGELTYHVRANLATGNSVHCDHLGGLKLRIVEERER